MTPPDSTKPVLHVLIIEDNADDALLAVRSLEHAGYAVRTDRVQTAGELRKTLVQSAWDLVLADYSLPHFSAPEALAILKEAWPDIPFIVVSGKIGEDIAVQLMKDGAADYVMKDDLPRLGPAVQREIHDAEERRRKREAEQALKEAEERYRALVESQTDLIVRTGPDQRFSYANPTYCALFGKSLQELTDSSYQPLIHPDDVASVTDATAGLFHPPYSCRYEARVMTVSGWRWIEWNSRAELDSKGTVVALLGSGRDITDRKQMEEKLRMSEFDLRQAQAMAHIGSWRRDVAHDKLTWSDEMYRIYGIDPKAFTGSWHDVVAHAVHPDDRIRVEESNRNAVEGHNPQPLEYRIVRPDGSTRIVWDEAGEMTLDDKGHVCSLTGVVLDITDRRRAETEKAAMQDKLLQAQKMEAIGELAGGIAHDFNNLLTGILGNISLIKSNLPASDQLHSYLLAAETAAHQAADLTRGLLTFGRRAMVSTAPLDMAEVIDTALMILKQSLPASINIVRDVEKPSWSVLADHSQIAQVILNLAVNARDAMRGKGTLTIRLRNTHIDEQYVREHPLTRTGEFVHLSIADTGPGIPGEILKHLFEPFYTTKPIGSGTGLGLSIVYGAVTQANGWVTAESSPGAGAVFNVFLPRCLDKPAVPVAAVHLSAGIRGGTILVVEDEPIVCAVAQALLTRDGCNVLTAGDSAAALATFQKHSDTIDLVFLDMTMPGMTTDEIICGIRVINAHVPILLTSGYTSGSAVKRMLDEGAVQGFLAKPYEPGQLVENVRKLMQH